MLDFLKSTFLFSGLDPDVMNEIGENLKYEVRKYDRTDVIFSPSRYENKVGFIVKGFCDINQRTTDGKVILNSLTVGDSFGIITLFCEECFPTEIYAKKNCEVMFIDKDEFERLIKTYPQIAINALRFLAKKISFLNSRIENVTRISVDKKLCSYLLGKVKTVFKLEFELNISKCSESINAGRASVYRALKTLENKGYIKADNRHIKILDKEKMEEYIK